MLPPTVAPPPPSQSPVEIVSGVLRANHRFSADIVDKAVAIFGDEWSDRFDADIAAMLGEMRSLREKYDATGNKGFVEQSDAKLQQAVEAYDWRQLYNVLVDIKKKFPEETIVNVGADPDIPFELLIKTMDATRFRYESNNDSGKFDSDDLFATAPYKESTTDKAPYAVLFSDVVLAVIQ